MEFIDNLIQQYAEDFTSPENETLKELKRETYAKVLMPRMLSGHIQGQWLSMVSYMISPKIILEIGTFTGYSAICLAKGLQKNGKLITIDINEELESMVKTYFAKANLTEIIDYKIGNALKIIPNIIETIDLVFIDADKENYSNYFDLVIDKVKSGGFILADNVLWSGKILEDKKDKDTAAIHAFNEKIKNDYRVEQILLPIRDGILVIRKK